MAASLIDQLGYDRTGLLKLFHCRNAFCPWAEAAYRRMISNPSAAIFSLRMRFGIRRSGFAVNKHMNRIVIVIIAQRKRLPNTTQRNAVRNNLRRIHESAQNELNAFVVEAPHIDIALRLGGIDIDAFPMDLKKINGTAAYADAPVHHHFSSERGAINGIYHSVAFE